MVLIQRLEHGLQMVDWDRLLLSLSAFARTADGLLSKRTVVSHLQLPIEPRTRIEKRVVVRRVSTQ